MVIQVDSTQDVALVELCLACTREYLSETVPGIVFAEPGGVRAYLRRGFSWANNLGLQMHIASMESVSLRVRMKG
jgi:hypothetical protein